MNSDRTYIRTLAKQYEDAGKPTEWFDLLNSQAKDRKVIVPWADLKANPNLVQAVNLLVHSTGVKVYGESEWKVYHMAQVA
jgi:hypothetical protein